MTESPTPHTSARRGSVPSFHTILLGAVGFFAVIALAVLDLTGVLAADTTLLVVDLGSIAVSAFAAGVIIMTALSFGRGTPVSRQWLLIGIGVGLYALGDTVWAYIEIIAGLDPYPSFADVFYFAQYGFIFAGIVMAALSYRRMIDMKRPFVIATAVSIGAALVIYFTLLKPYILPAGPDELEPLAKFVSTAYPLADVFLMLAPAVFIGAVVSRLGRGKLAVPWWAVALAAVLYAVTDSAYSLADWAGTAESNIALLNSGWLIANVVFMVAVLLARDVYRS